MGTRWYGIGAAQNDDNVGEKLLLDGLEDRVKFIRDEHDDLSAFRLLGSVNNSKKIYSEKDCEDEQQRRCWKHAGVPFLYVAGEFADDQDHPNAQSAASLLKFTSRNDVPLKMGLSIDGGIIERQTPDGRPTEDKDQGKILARTLGSSVAFTVKPCNPKCAIFLENDLAKSDYKSAPPARYFEALKKSQAKHSFNEIPEWQLYIKLDNLKKSLVNYTGGFTSMKCHTCGTNQRFFKSSTDMPNGCSKCGKNYSMAQLWKALNK